MNESLVHQVILGAWIISNLSFFLVLEIVVELKVALKLLPS